jgi:hypothetical protein
VVLDYVHSTSAYGTTARTTMKSERERKRERERREKLPRKGLHFLSFSLSLSLSFSIALTNYATAEKQEQVAAAAAAAAAGKCLQFLLGGEKKEKRGNTKCGKEWVEKNKEGERRRRRTAASQSKTMRGRGKKEGRKEAEKGRSESGLFLFFSSFLALRGCGGGGILFPLSFLAGNKSQRRLYKDLTISCKFRWH